jgi:DNA-directed RNA polymerase specialized sigma24 family protein
MTGDQYSNGIEWMLQNPQVDDPALSSAMQAEYLEELQAFAFRMTEDKLTARQFASEAIERAVNGRHRLFPDSSLRAWLYAHIYQRCQSSKMGKLKRLIRRQPDPCSELSSGFSDKGLDARQALVLTLHYGYGFSTAEIASVLDRDTVIAQTILNQARRLFYLHLFPGNELSEEHLETIGLIHTAAGNPSDPELKLTLHEHLQNCPACQEYANRLPELESHLSELSSAPRLLEPVPEISAVPLETNHQNHRRRLSLPVKELALVGVLLVALMALGRNQGVFDSFDARPTPTPQAEPEGTPQPTQTQQPTSLPRPTLLPTPVLPGTEGRDYFFFQTFSRTEEFIDVFAERTGLTPDEIRGLNGIRGDVALFPVGRQLKLAIFRDSSWFTPIQPDMPDAPDSPDALDESSTAAEIFDRVQEQYNQYFWPVKPGWRDFITVHHGPPGIIGDPIIQRMQIWIGSDRHQILAASSGDIDGNEDVTEFILFRVGNWSFYPSGVAQAEFTGYWSDDENPDMMLLPISPILSLYYYWSNISEDQVRVVGSGVIAGRQAIIVDLLAPEGHRTFRIWMDAHTGEILGLDDYSQYSRVWIDGAAEFSDNDGRLHDEEHPILSFRVNALADDLEFPADMFFPPGSPVTGLARDYTGVPLAEDPSALPIDYTTIPFPQRIVEHIPPPDSFDLSRAPLIFQLPERAAGNPNSEAGPRFEVFAGGYYLGSLADSVSSIRTCTRSPDGLYAAYTAGQHWLFSDMDSLYLLSLSPLESRMILTSSVGSSLYSFSPQGDLLAYATCNGRCHITLVDLESGKFTLFVYLSGFPTNLAWSPDGEQIASMTVAGRPGPVQVEIHEVSTQDLVFSGSYNRESGIFDPASPTEDWGIPFPGSGDQNDCYRGG